MPAGFHGRETARPPLRAQENRFRGAPLAPGRPVARGPRRSDPERTAPGPDVLHTLVSSPLARTVRHGEHTPDPTGAPCRCGAHAASLQLGGNGQAARTFCGLARGLRAEGAEVSPFITCGQGAPERTLPGVRVVPPAAHDESDRLTALLDNSQALVAALFAAGPFDAVVELMASCGTAGREFARAAALPLVLRVTERIWEGAETLRSAGAPRIAAALCIDALRAADMVAVPHDGLARAISRLGVSRSRILVQPTGVDLLSFASATASPPLPHVDDGPSILLAMEREQPTAVELCVEAIETLRERRRVSLRIATSAE